MAIRKNKVEVELRLLAQEFNAQLSATNRALSESKTGYRYLANEMKYTSSEADKMKAAVRGLREQYQLQAQNVRAAEQALEAVNSQQAAGTETVKEFTRQLDYEKDRLQQIKNGLYEAEKAANIHNDAFYKGGEAFTKYGEHVETAGRKIESVGNKLSIVSGVVGAFGVASVKAYTEYESALAGVRKTTDMTDAEMAEFDRTVRALSEQLPTSQKDIAGVAESAGQLGIETKNLIPFTKTMIDLSNATNISLSEGSAQIAQYSNVTGMAQQDVDRFGSAIVALGNNTATNEQAILSMAQRIGSAGAAVKMTDAEMLAWSATLASTGLEAQAGGSAFSKMVTMIETAVQTGSVEIEDYARVSGMSADAFAKAWRDDASGALVTFFNGLKKIDENGGSVIETLDSMGLSELRLSDMIRRTAGASGEMNKNLDLANHAWEENNALTKEAAQRYETTESKVEMSKNKIRNLQIEIGEKLLPIVADGLGLIDQLLDSWNGLSDAEKDHLINLGKMVVVAGPAVRILGTLTSTVGGLMKGLGAAGKAIGTLSGTLRTAKPVADGAATALSSVGTQSGGLASILTGRLHPATLAVGAGIAVASLATYEWLRMDRELNEQVVRTKENTGFLTEVVMGFNGEVVKSQKELEEESVLLREFSEGTSQEFRDAMEAARKDVQDFNIELEKTSLDGVFTEEESAALVERVTTYAAQVKETVSTHTDEVKARLEESFMVDNGVLDENEKIILGYFERSKGDQAQKVQEIQDEILRIQTAALEERRGLTEDEKDMIEDKWKQLHRLEVEGAARTEEDKLTLANEYDARMAALDAESASAFLTQQKAQTETAQEEIKRGYDLEILALQSKLDSMSATERTAAEAEIAEKTQQRDAALRIEQEKYDGLLGIIMTENPNLVSHINQYTGEIASRTEKANADQLTNMRSMYEGLEQATKTGYYNVYNKTMQGTDKLMIVVDEKTGQITGMWNTQTDESGAATDRFAQKVEELKQTHARAAENILLDVAEMAAGSGKGMKLMKEDFDRLGIKIEDTGIKVGDFKQGIAEVNGQKIVVTYDDNGTIGNLDTILSRLYEIRDNKYQTLTIDRVVNHFENHIRSYTTRGGSSRGTVSSYFAGIDYVPYNDMPARLHVGERVLTASENERYNQTSVDYLASIIERLNRVVAKAEQEPRRSTRGEDAPASRGVVQNFNGSFSFLDERQMERFWEYGEKRARRRG